MKKITGKKIFALFILILFLSGTSAPNQESAESTEKSLEKARTAFKANDFFSALKYSQESFKAEKDDEIRAEALYLYGKIAETLTAELTRMAWRQVKPRGRGYWDDDFIAWAGLKVYEQVGLKFAWSHFGQVYEYDGASYAEIVRNYSKTKWACAASFRLLKLAKMRSEEWGGNIGSAHEEIKTLEVSLGNCPQAEIKYEILLAIARDYIYLIGCHQYRSSPNYDADKAIIYLQKTEEILGRIKKEFQIYENVKETKYIADSLDNSRQIIKNGGVVKRRSARSLSQ